MADHQTVRAGQRWEHPVSGSWFEVHSVAHNEVGSLKAHGYDQNGAYDLHVGDLHPPRWVLTREGAGSLIRDDDPRLTAVLASAPLRPKPAPRPQPKTFRIGQRWLRKSDQLEGDVVGVNCGPDGHVIGALRMQDRTIVPVAFSAAGWTFIGGSTEYPSPQEALAEAVETAKMLCPVGVRQQDWHVVLAGLQQHLAQGGLRLDADQYLWTAQLAGLVLVDYARASKERDR